VLLELGVEDLAKYPFLEETGNYIRSRGFTISEISQPEFKKVVERAKERVLQAIRLQKISRELDEPEVEIFSFPISLLLIKASNLDYLFSRYSLSEAVRVEKILETERIEIVTQIFRKVFHIDLTTITGEHNTSKSVIFRIPIMEYLKRSVKFHELEWKLVNRVVDKGYVFLNTHDLIRLIRQEIDNMILDRLRNLVVSKLPENLEKIVEYIVKTSPSHSSHNYQIHVSPDKYPPCVKKAIELIKNGENLPHYGRFLLTTYLVNIGHSTEDIISIYPKSPDFNERITRYQVEHISGLRGGRVKYRCPSCRTLITHSFCFKTKECANIKNPLMFGRPKYRSKKSSVKKWTKRQR
jgi:DNA primase large subunit